MADAQHAAAPQERKSGLKSVAALTAGALIVGAVVFATLSKSDGGRDLPVTKSGATEFLRVKIGTREFKLEIAADAKTREKGLGDRRELASDGGMIFIFPRAAVLQFVMRDCYIPIDVLFLDGAGRVVAQHAMTVEPPRRENERPEEYERRLKQYSSNFAAQFALEFKGGTLEQLRLRNGDRIDLDVAALKKRAK